MEKKRKIRNDIILIAAIFVAAAVAFIIFSLSADMGSFAVVTVDGAEVGTYPLDKDITEVISGANDGYNILVIENGSAYISEASCPDGICSRHKPIKYEGSTIVCLPNKVVVTVIGEKDTPQVDVVS